MWQSVYNTILQKVCVYSFILECQLIRFFIATNVCIVNTEFTKVQDVFISINSVKTKAALTEG